MAWTTPKTDYVTGDGVSFQTKNKEGNNLLFLKAIQDNILNGTQTVGNADTVDGKHVNTAGTGGWPTIVDKIPFINSSGVLEMGRYIDWHFTDSTSDYDARMYMDSTDILKLAGADFEVSSGRLIGNQGITAQNGDQYPLSSVGEFPLRLQGDGSDDVDARAYRFDVTGALLRLQSLTDANAYVGQLLEFDHAGTYVRLPNKVQAGSGSGEINAYLFRRSDDDNTYLKFAGGDLIEWFTGGTRRMLMSTNEIRMFKSLVLDTTQDNLIMTDGSGNVGKRVYAFDMDDDNFRIQALADDGAFLRNILSINNDGKTHRFGSGSDSLLQAKKFSREDDTDTYINFPGGNIMELYAGGVRGGRLTSSRFEIAKAKFLKEDNASEGGQIELEKATNSSLAGDVIIDQNGDSVRIFEGATPFKGAYLDLTDCESSVASKIVTYPPNTEPLRTGTSTFVAGSTQQTISSVFIHADSVILIDRNDNFENYWRVAVNEGSFVIYSRDGGPDEPLIAEPSSVGFTYTILNGGN